MRFSPRGFLQLTTLVPGLSLCIMLCTAPGTLAADQSPEPVPGTLSDKQLHLAEKAQRARENDRFGKAASLYNALANRAQSMPEKMHWMALRGHCLYEKENWAKTLQAYRQVIESRAATVDLVKVAENLRVVALNLADTSGLFQNRESAIEAANLVRAITPAPHVGLRVARWHSAQGDIDKAVKTYHSVIEQHPRHPAALEARVELAQVYATLAAKKGGAGRFAGFSRFYLNRARERAEGMLNRAAASRQQDRQDRAQTLERKARAVKQRCKQVQRRVDSIQAERLFRIARFYTWPAQRRPEQARRYLRRAVEKYPSAAAAQKAQTLLARLQKTDTAAGKDDGQARQPDTGRELREPPDIEPGQKDRTGKNKVSRYLRPLEDLSTDESKE